MDPRQPAERIPSILVVDDDPVARTAMCGYLREAGYAVREAGGGGDALALFDERGADAVLLDWRMPDKGGAEVLPRIAAQDPTVPVIVVSGTSEVRELARALRLGAWDFVIKPIDDMAVLDRALVRCLLRAELLREQGRRRETLEDLVRRRTEDLEDANRRLRREIAERREFERALAESEERFRQLMENSSEVFWVRDLASDRLLYLSPAYETVWGRPVREAMRGGNPRMGTVHPDDRNALETAMAGIVTSATPVDAEFRIMRPDGEVRWVHARAFPVRDGEGNVYRVAGLAEDVTARRTAEEGIRASLREKEILLREVHHRVKNNLQLIVSLLNLQAAYADGAADRERFIESRNRVASMALAHEELYRANDLASVNVADYVERLARKLAQSSVDAEVELALDLPPLFLPVSAAIPCGLILNELVTNAIKHAFPGRDAGRIAIAARRHGRQVEVRVSDDGAGLPEGFDPAGGATLGMQLVGSLVAQLGGRLEVASGIAGASFVVRFEENEAEPYGADTPDATGAPNPLSGGARLSGTFIAPDNGPDDEPDDGTDDG
ncbi:sensor histidine kinase [Nitratidesulfovibrio sp. SRB-5]|uniref:sensor histidine kinase n=1 Tax=Nitratidesulfovibrio sp. SRB-5 TaxID=2872636 RepID=UPI00102706BC|nr:response regulator [Nitratidesulfovibrio sp. SRB-5]MBZ2172425.1 response regulator [Nitratidesulfovibrio sp. SRB-5]RXF76602.1 response regulator [Desulfovibrio sp. DS-1]